MLAFNIQIQAEQALQNITAAMEQASGHRQEAAVLKNQLAADQVTPAHQRCAPPKRYVDTRLH